MEGIKDLYDLKSVIYKEACGDDKKGSTRDDYFEFFEDRFPESKKCLLRNVVMSKSIDPQSGWLPIQNFKDEIESIAIDSGLSPTHIKRHLAGWCLNKKKELLIDIPKWDGIDHIQDALDRMYVTNVEHNHFVELMKEWFSNIVRRMYDSEHQNRCVILRGKQGIGKDYSIKKMLSGFGHYANEIEFGQSKTEIYRVIKGLAVGIIPEFDETHKSTVATIKSVITASTTEQRALYKENAQSLDLHTSFISASNFRHILRDPTGNRRFMIFDVNKMDHTFEKVNGLQIAAQAHELAKQKFLASDAAQTAMKEIIASETPESTDDLFLEEVRALIKKRQGKGQDGAVKVEYRVTWDMIKQEIRTIAHSYNFGMRRAQSLIKSDNLRHRDHDGVHYDARS